MGFQTTKEQAFFKSLADVVCCHAIASDKETVVCSFIPSGLACQECYTGWGSNYASNSDHRTAALCLLPFASCTSAAPLKLYLVK